MRIKREEGLGKEVEKGNKRVERVEQRVRIYILNILYYYI